MRCLVPVAIVPVVRAPIGRRRTQAARRWWGGQLDDDDASDDDDEGGAREGTELRGPRDDVGPAGRAGPLVPFEPELNQRKIKKSCFLKPNILYK